ncbi:hypothetical protein JZ751_004194 [Albula glossodonta]|uniref:Transcription factor Elf N-terminal domain-containing protein n=1 Tax=Albula glossodonta TaxID=121402 RepID=A0A8T2MPP3_9TELE|nr:hypothetical protein JZ751_004194 [Albula glossodonta]
MTSVVVVDSGGPAVEYVSTTDNPHQRSEPRLISLLRSRLISSGNEQGLVLVYDDETYLMQDVAEEQEVETEVTETASSYMERHRS